MEGSARDVEEECHHAAATSRRGAPYRAPLSDSWLARALWSAGETSGFLSLQPAAADTVEHTTRKLKGDNFFNVHSASSRLPLRKLTQKFRQRARSISDHPFSFSLAV